MSEPTLEAHELYRFYHANDDEVLALRGVSLRVESGEVVAIMGPSGSGKSTLLACVAGLDEPDAGHVRVCGEMVTRRSEPVRAAIRARSIGVVFQSNNLVPHLSIEGNVRLAQRIGAHDDRARREELLDRLGIAGRAHARPSQLSGGEAVRAGLACALVSDPPLLVADEPTAEIDDATEQRVLDLLAREAASGRAIVVATHSDAVAVRADRVVELADGRVQM